MNPCSVCCGKVPRSSIGAAGALCKTALCKYLFQYHALMFTYCWGCVMFTDLEHIAPNPPQCSICLSSTYRINLLQFYTNRLPWIINRTDMKGKVTARCRFHDILCSAELHIYCMWWMVSFQLLTHILTSSLTTYLCGYLSWLCMSNYPSMYSFFCPPIRLSSVRVHICLSLHLPIQSLEASGSAVDWSTTLKAERS
jgi:hypothetical protein